MDGEREPDGLRLEAPGEVPGAVPGPDPAGKAHRGQAPDRSLGRVGFATGAGTYDRARPDYPAGAVAHLAETTGIGPASRVADVAAGTGKMTKPLAAAGAGCVGVEPSAAMRATFHAQLPDVPVVGGLAEHLPLAGSAFDVVVAAQAFHWFDAPVALAEIARVLRPGGWLALAWNERDEEDPLVAELVRVSRWDTCRPYPVAADFRQPVEASGRFGPVGLAEFRFTQELDRATFVDQVASRSYVAVLDDGPRRELLDRVAELAATVPEPIPIPYWSRVYTARLARGAGG